MRIMLPDPPPQAEQRRRFQAKEAARQAKVREEFRRQQSLPSFAAGGAMNFGFNEQEIAGFGVTPAAPPPPVTAAPSAAPPVVPDVPAIPARTVLPPPAAAPTPLVPDVPAIPATTARQSARPPQITASRPPAAAPTPPVPDVPAIPGRTAPPPAAAPTPQVTAARPSQVPDVPAIPGRTAPSTARSRRSTAPRGSSTAARPGSEFTTAQAQQFGDTTQLSPDAAAALAAGQRVYECRGAAVWQ